jgi:D-tyrosyl-tRNA(Tyr) deacylase
LLADISSGNRPGFTDAEEPDIARIRCGEVAAQLLERGIRIAYGEFGTNMLVTLENDGPVTIVLDSKTQFKLSQSD